MMAAGCARFGRRDLRGPLPTTHKLVGCCRCRAGCSSARTWLDARLAWSSAFSSFVGGASRRWIIVTLLTLVVIVAGGLGSTARSTPGPAGDIQILKPYQMSRLLVFIDQDNPPITPMMPTTSTRRKIAVGSWRDHGQGLWQRDAVVGRLSARGGDGLHLLRSTREQARFFLGALVRCSRCTRPLMAVALTIGLRASDKLAGSCIVAGVMGMWCSRYREHRHGPRPHAHHGHPPCPS